MSTAIVDDFFYPCTLSDNSSSAFLSFNDKKRAFLFLLEFQKTTIEREAPVDQNHEMHSFSFISLSPLPRNICTHSRFFRMWSRRLARAAETAEVSTDAMMMRLFVSETFVPFPLLSSAVVL
jgi:hypothetical protein